MGQSYSSRSLSRAVEWQQEELLNEEPVQLDHWEDWPNQEMIGLEMEWEGQQLSRLAASELMPCNSERRESFR